MPCNTVLLVSLLIKQSCWKACTFPSNCHQRMKNLLVLLPLSSKTLSLHQPPHTNRRMGQTRGKTPLQRPNRSIENKDTTHTDCATLPCHKRLRLQGLFKPRKRALGGQCQPPHLTLRSSKRWSQFLPTQCAFSNTYDCICDYLSKK